MDKPSIGSYLIRIALIYTIIFSFSSHLISFGVQANPYIRVGQEWQEQLESGGVIVGNRYPRHTFPVNPAGPLSKGHFSDIDHRFWTELIQAKLYVLIQSAGPISATS